MLSDFLKTAAVKETMAKVKLESFVLDLFDHADKTERELRYLGNMSTSHLVNVVFSRPSAPLHFAY